MREENIYENRKIKDSVFVDLFSTDERAKENFLSLYNGADDYPGEKTLRLSDAFAENKMSENVAPPLEILVKVININTEKHADVLGRCRVLADYSKFMELVRAEKSAGNAAFVRDAVHEALSRGVLSEYLSRKRWEVDDMTFAEYNYDMDIAVQRREAFEDGQEQGAHEKAVETARNFLSLGIVTPEQIAQATGLPLAEVQALAQTASA